MPPISDRTRLIAGATRRGQGRRPVNPPVERASTMLSDDPARMQDASDGPVYGLDGTSAARELRALLAQMEGGTDAFLVPSGLAAVTVPLTALLRPGDEVLTTDAVYGPTRRFLTRHLAARGITARFHPADASTEAVLTAITPRTRLLLIEAPASLTFEIADAPALAAACRERGVLTVMDNTWAAGLVFRPLAHGLDVSVQALTKYVGGHSDLIAGGCMGGADIMARVGEMRTICGTTADPHTAWLLLRSLETLHIRMERAQDNALILAERLRADPRVSAVLTAGGPDASPEQQAIFEAQCKGSGSTFSLELPGGEAEAFRMLNALRLFKLAVSLGGAESLASHPSSMTHSDYTAEAKARSGIGDNLVRLSVGIENVDDLWADLDQALSTI